MKILHWSIACSLVGVLACGASPVVDDASIALLGLVEESTEVAATETSFASDPRRIENGDVVPIDNASEREGVVQIGVTISGIFFGTCTGTLVTNSWIVTAAHCVDTLANRGGFLEGSGGEQDFDIDPNGILLHPTHDLALLRTTNPVTIGSSDNGHQRRIYSDSNVSLLDKDLLCMGYGYNAEGTGDGTLREGLFTVKDHYSTNNSLGYDGQYMKLGSSNYRILEGDSGGPCFYQGKLTAVNHGYNDLHSFVLSWESMLIWVYDRIKPRLTVRIGMPGSDSVILMVRDFGETFPLPVLVPSGSGDIIRNKMLWSDARFTTDFLDTTPFGVSSKFIADPPEGVVDPVNGVTITVHSVPTLWAATNSGPLLW